MPAKICVFDTVRARLAVFTLRRACDRKSLWLLATATNFLKISLGPLLHFIHRREPPL